MLVDESKSISAASTILESLVSVFNGETGLLVSSGFVWSIAANDNNWYVATTATDLSKNSKSLQVEFADGREYAATVAFSDIDTNIAFLRVNKVEGNKRKDNLFNLSRSAKHTYISTTVGNDS